MFFDIKGKWSIIRTRKLFLLEGKMPAATVLRVVESECTSETVAQLITALCRHGFSAESDMTEFCNDDSLPCIHVFCFTAKDEEVLMKDRARLTELVIRYYEETVVPEDKDRDTHLVVQDFDHDIDRNLEFEFGYKLSFQGLNVLRDAVLMPKEIFQLTPDDGRSIEERYRAKLRRFTDFLNHLEPTVTST